MLRNTLIILFVLLFTLILSCSDSSTEPKETEDTVTDIDGNVYHTVKIGNQLWMAENLKVTHFRNGDAIPHVTANNTWKNLETEAYCIYNNADSNVVKYGLLYNWYAVDDNRKIAPSEWHVPTDDDWKQLEMYLGMSQTEAYDTGLRGTDEGTKLKATNSWIYTGNGTNESGFSGLPGGARSPNNGYFSGMGEYGFWWASTVFSSYPWSRNLYSRQPLIGREYLPKQLGYSVRLIHD